MPGVYSYRFCYAAVRPFTEDARAAVHPWLEELGLSRLQTLITLDMVLRDAAIDPADVRHDDIRYLADDDPVSGFFSELEPLLAMVQGQDAEILAALYEPVAEAPGTQIDARFRFAGYDIMDRWIGNSLLLNCGRFPEAFSPDLLNDVGLLSSLAEATAVKCRLLTRYPRHEHVQGCGVWELWTYPTRLPAHR